MSFVKVCPILQAGSQHQQFCLGELCEWWQNGCPAHPKPPEPTQTIIKKAKK